MVTNGRKLRWGWLWVVLIVVGCGDGWIEHEDAGVDGGMDAGTDGGLGDMDAGRDGSTADGALDAETVLDAGVDGAPRDGGAVDGAADGSTADGGTSDGGGDGSASDGGGDAGPPPPKVVFVTSTAHTGDLGGLAGADAICAGLASDAGLSGTFRAWLSTDDMSAASRLTHADVPYVRTDGMVVADGWTDLVDGTLMNPINRDQNNVARSGDVWTGTLLDGTSHAFADCDGWTQAISGPQGQCGSAASAAKQWTENIVPYCTLSLRLYCFQQ